MLLAICEVARSQNAFSTKTVPKLAGCCQHALTGINDRGEVVGYSVDAYGQVRVITWSKTGGLKVLQVGRGTAMNLGGDILVALGRFTGGLLPNGAPFVTIPGSFGLNDKREVVGQILSAFRWTAEEGAVDLGWGDSSAAGAVNNAGQIVGERNVSIYAHAVIDNLDIHGIGWESFATAINNRGQVTGYSEMACPTGPAWCDYHGWLWDRDSGTSLTDLGPMPGCPKPSYVRPYAINESGMIVGTACGKAFLWRPALGVLEDLNTLTGTTNGSDPLAVGINRWGQIALTNRRVLTPIMRVTITSSSNPSRVGDEVVFTASVDSIIGPPPDGEILQVKVGTVLIGSIPLRNGQAQWSSQFVRPAYPFTISATYVGDAIYAKASNHIPQTVIP